MTLIINGKTYEAGELIAYVGKLEKENVELKEELKDANEKVVHLACNQNKDLKRKITKAKELLKEFIFLLHNPRTALDTKTVMNKAEQFLKDSETDKIPDGSITDKGKEE